MKSRKFLNAAASLALSATLTAMLFAVVDCGAVFFQLRISSAAFAPIVAVIFTLLHFCKLFTPERKKKAILWLLTLGVLLCTVCWGIWHCFQKNAAYWDVDEEKKGLYADRNVMVLVPHQDDEVNLLCGVLEEFASYGSNVRVVYATNGDAEGIPETRLREAIAYCSYAGIPEENVIFLGYGDRWDNDRGVHLYNAPVGSVVSSRFGAAATYALEEHPAFHQGNSYTVENYLSDLEEVILTYKPGLIFCVDYDDHIEHQALSLSFEKVMGKILKENPQYRPMVYKGYAYGTAWFGEADFYSINLQSTGNLFQEPYLQKPENYRWEERLRLPVDGAVLSRSLANSGAFRSLELFSSQNAQYRAQSIVNGDKVFWQRRTDSVCMSAQIQVSSGDGALLNNFMLSDNLDLWHQPLPVDGAWIPEEEDSEKCAAVVLEEPADLYSIRLYDHPSETENVLNACIRFDDGQELETGALHCGGAATEIVVNKSGVKSFSITLTDTEGTDAGLTEIEAYAVPQQGSLRVIKLMDDAGNFVYDYCIAQGDSAQFGIYQYGGTPAENTFSVSCDNAGITVSLKDGVITVLCPEGESGTIRLEKDGAVCDSIFVQNPGVLWKIHTRLGQRIEQFAVFQFRESIVFRIGRRILGLLY